MFGRYGCCVNEQALVVPLSQYEFLTPIAENITQGRRIVLGRIVGNSGKCENSATESFIDSSAFTAGTRRIHHLVEQVTIPVNALVKMAPVHSVLNTTINKRCRLILGTRDDARLGGSANRTRIVVGEIAAKGTSVIARSLQAIINLACSSIIIGTGRMGFVAGKLFQSLSVRVEISTMLRITMSQSCGTKSLAVIIYHHLSKDDFVSSVHIYISNGKIMISIAKPCTTQIIPAPSLG